MKFINRFNTLIIAGIAATVVACGGSSATPVDVLDAAIDSTVDAADDISQEVTTDIVPEIRTDISDDNDVPADSDETTDTADADIPADVTPDPGFTWASGCEPRQEYPTWTVIRDTTFLRGPLVQLSDRDTVTILWRTAEPSEQEGCVDWSYADKSGTECGSADEFGQYEVRIDNLPAGTEISYVARVGEQETTELTFRTMPDRPVEMKFAVFADSHQNEENLRTFSDLALAEGVDFVLGNGDLSGSAQVEEFDLTFRAFKDLGSRVNIWTTIGNHDEKNIPEYFNAFAMPHGNPDEPGFEEAWWSRRIGNVWIGGGWIRDFYLSSVDSDWGEVGWFRQQFESEEFKTAQWKLFFIHQPPFNLQWDKECVFDGEDCLQGVLIPLMDEFGLQASFHGHMHGIEYGEKDHVNMFTIGGLCDCGMDDEVCLPDENFPDPWHRIYMIPTFAIVETGCDGLKVRAVDLEGNDVFSVTLPEIPIRYEENIKLMSFNLRMPFDSEPGKTWDERKQPALNVINEFGPDIMVVQEGYLDTQDFISQNIPRLTWIGENRSGGFIDEYCAIFFDTQKFELIETKTMALSDTPETLGTKLDDENQLYPRIVTWGHFRRLSDNFEFDVFSTHWDHTGVVGIREQMAAITIQQMQELAEGRPILLAGDFNCGYQSEPYNIMTGASNLEGVTGSMIDTWTELELPEEGTFHSFTGTASGSRIDWVLHNEGFKAVSAEVIKTSYEGIYPSDHFPIGAEFSISRL